MPAPRTSHSSRSSSSIEHRQPFSSRGPSMEKPAGTSSRLSFLCASLIFLVFCSIIPGAKPQELEDEKEFSYEAGSENGPGRWGELHPEWSLCKNGTMQSPIDLADRRVVVAPGLGRLRMSYKPANASLRNRGHDIMLKWIGDAGSIHMDGVEYHLRQCHWHSPSEHSINGRRLEMEVHLVHQSSDNKTAVLGILYQTGRPDPFLSELTEPIDDVAKAAADESVEVGVVNPRRIQLGSRRYYRYMGSLTTPPCHQNVLWTISRTVRTVSTEQVTKLREAVHDGEEENARPLQEINKREIRVYIPQEQNRRRRR